MEGEERSRGETIAEEEEEEARGDDKEEEGGGERWRGGEGDLADRKRERMETEVGWPVGVGERWKRD